MKRAWLIYSILGFSFVMARGAENPPVPPLSQPMSPVTIFRVMLATNEAARAQWLAAKSPEQRRVLEGKIAEYAALAPAEREQRLQSLQLRWQLPRLMKLPVAEREPRLALIAEPIRSVLKTKLEIWDKMPADLQKDLLDNEQAIDIFMYAGVGSASGGVFHALSAQRQEELRQQFEELNKLPESRRAQILFNFRRFFEMPLTEQDKTLQKIQPPNAMMVRQTIDTFKILPPPLQDKALQESFRNKALEGFEKYSRLSPEDRAAFLKSAERWQSMNEAERDKWRRMVIKLRSVNAIPPPMPPMPPKSTPSLAGKNP